MVCTLLAGVNVVAFAAEDSDSVSIFRAYNPNNGEHLYTDATEYAAVVAQGYNGEGDAWKAPSTSNSPIFRAYNPNSGEHMLASQAEVEALAAVGWNNEGQKMYSDDEQGVPIYRVYNPNASGQYAAGAHHYTASREEAAGLVAQGWNWDNQGQPVLYGVKDSSVLVELVDNSGLQSDGTGLVGDELQAKYSTGLGNPAQVTWYKDGGALTSTSMMMAFTLDTTNYGAGTYTAVITNTQGQSFTTNAIVVVNDQELAKITEYELTQDYAGDVSATTGTSSVDYADKTDKIVATITLNKSQYQGMFGILETETVMSGSATATDIIATAPTHTVVMGETVELFQEVTNKAKFTDAEALENSVPGTLNGIYFDNPDGSRTYKWVVSYNHNADSAATLTRGTDYFVGFYHEGVSEQTDITTFALGGSDTAPYLEAPTAVTISTCAANQPVKVDILGADGKKIAWMGGKDASTPDPIGLDSSIIYKNSSNGETGKQVFDNNATDALKGTISSANNVDTNYSYYWAELTWPEGIFGEEELTLKSDIQKIANRSLDAINVYEDPTNHSNAVVTFRNLATDGTVLLLNRDTFENAQKDLADGKTSAVVGTATAKRGDSKITIAGALKSAEKTTVDNYYAFFVPNDLSEFGVGATEVGMNTSYTEVPDQADAGFNGLTVVQMPAIMQLAVSVNKATMATTGAAIDVTFENEDNTLTTVIDAGNKNLVVLKDQFGVELAKTGGVYDQSAAIALLGMAWDLEQVGSTKTGIDKVTVSLDVNSDGYTILSVESLTDAGDPAIPVAATKWSGTTDAGQTINVEIAKDGATVTLTIQ